MSQSCDINIETDHYIQIFWVESLRFRSCKSYSGLEKSTHPLAMTSTSCCRGSRNFDEVIEFTKNMGICMGKNLQKIWAYVWVRIFHPCFHCYLCFTRTRGP